MRITLVVLFLKVEQEADFQLSAPSPVEPAHNLFSVDRDSPLLNETQNFPLFLYLNLLVGAGSVDPDLSLSYPDLGCDH